LTSLRTSNKILIFNWQTWARNTSIPICIYIYRTRVKYYSLYTLLANTKIIFSLLITIIFCCALYWAVFMSYHSYLTNQYTCHELCVDISFIFHCTEDLVKHFPSVFPLPYSKTLHSWRKLCYVSGSQLNYMFFGSQFNGPLGIYLAMPWANSTVAVMALLG
jgi:hypothetical protein